MSVIIRSALVVSVTSGLLASALGSAAAASNKAQRVTFYAYEQVWPAAIRFLRVDEGFEIVEKDLDAGYVLFAVHEDNKRFRGSLELVRFQDHRNRPALRILLHIEDRPAYMAQGLLDRFEHKLRSELGRPPPPPVKAPPDKAPPDKAPPDKAPSATRPGPDAQFMPVGTWAWCTLPPHECASAR